MVSSRLDALVMGYVQRTYLYADDGYWADLVLAEFGFLEERGGELDEVRFHQQGDYVRFVGPWGSVLLEFFPDNYPRSWIHSHAQLRGPEASFEGDLDLLMRLRQQGYVRVARDPMSRETIAGIVRGWADALRGATDLF
jgi:hypothetical protein